MIGYSACGLLSCELTGSSPISKQESLTKAHLKAREHDKRIRSMCHRNATAIATAFPGNAWSHIFPAAQHLFLFLSSFHVYKPRVLTAGILHPHLVPDHVTNVWQDREFLRALLFVSWRPADDEEETTEAKLQAVEYSGCINAQLNHFYVTLT